MRAHIFLCFFFFAIFGRNNRNVTSSVLPKLAFYRIVSLAAVFSLVTQRSSPQMAAHIPTTFLTATSTNPPGTIRVTYVENSARQSNLNNNIVCFILEFKAFKMATFEEAFDVVSNTFRIPKLKCAAKELELGK